MTTHETHKSSSTTTTTTASDPSARQRLGRTGPSVFPIGLGCMGMSALYGRRTARSRSRPSTPLWTRA